MGTCINTKSPVFKEKAKALNISEGQLENILHEYYNSESLQKTISEDDFIKSKLEGIPNYQGTELMIKAWDVKYSKPMEFSTIQEFNTAKAEAIEIFGDMPIGHKETPDGKHILSVARPRRENESLWRGVPYKPTIDSDGNLVIPAGWDNLFQGYGVSFATKEGPAFEYGRRNSRNPYVIRIDREFLDTLYPFNKEGGTKSIGNRVIGDEYGEEGSYEERAIMQSSEDVLVIPKEYYSVEHTPVDTTNKTAMNIAVQYIQYSAEANAADELVFSQIEGHASENDASELFDALVQKLGSKQNAYLMLAYAQEEHMRSAPTERYFDYLDSEHKKIFLDSYEDLPEGTFLRNFPFSPESMRYTLLAKERAKEDFISEDLPFNRQPKTPVSVLKDAHLINNYATPEGWYAVNGLDGEARANLVKLKQVLKEQGFNDAYDISRRFDQRKREHILISFKEPINLDAVKREAVKDLTSIHSVMQFLTDKIPTLQGHVHEVSVSEANTILDGKLQSNETAFIKNGEIYLIKGRVTKDAAIEEGLHVVTMAMRYENPELYQSLVDEAKKAFPDLFTDIQRTYDASEVNNEVITQALARVFRQEYDNVPPTKRKTIADFINKFVEWFNNLFNRFIKDSYTGKYVVELNKLPKIMKLSDMADLLLAPDSTFGVAMPVNRNVVFNKASEIQAPLPESPLSRIRPENRAFFQRQQLLRRKLDTLYNNEVGLTTSEVDEEATKLAEWVGDNITEIQTHPEKYYEIFGKPKTNEWATEADKKKDIDAVKTMSRRDIVANIGIPKFLDIYRNQIFIDNEALDDLSHRDLSKVGLLKDNVDVLFELGMATFNDSEGYSIIHNDELGTDEIVDTQQDSTTPEGISDDGAIVQEEEGNLEDWMVDKATIEVLGNATALIRSALSKLYLLDENGDVKTDYLGRGERISQNDAVKSIIRWVQGSLNLQMMIQKLEAKQAENPWVSSILEKLYDKSGAQTEFISQFYTVFQKHFQLFDVIKKGKKNKKNYTMDVNSSPALDNIYNYVVAMQAIGESPMFTSNGINSSALAQWESIVDKLKVNTNVTEEQFNQYKNGFVSRFTALARLLGYEFKADDVKKSLTYDNFKKAVTAADGILSNLKREANNSEYSPYVYKEKGNYIGGYVKDLLRELSHSIEDTTESSFYENGKMRQSNQIPSYASKLSQKLRGDAETFKTSIEEEFGKYEWFRNADGTWRMPWMKELVKMDEDTRKKVLVHKVNLNYQGDQYMRGLSAERYALSTLTEFASGKRSANSTQIAFYGFPIQSNKATSDYLSFYRYTGDLYKATIKNGILSIFGQELSRIQTVRMRDRKEGDIDYIEGFDKRGRDFCLLDFFNDPSQLVRENGLISADEAAELSSLIDSKISGKEIDEARLNLLAKKAIEENFNQQYERLLTEYRNLGLIDAIGNIEGVVAKVSKYPKNVQVEQFIENFVWNDAFAKMNIIEMLVTDPAFYKSDDDFQKRFAQVHSPGTRGNADATDYNGNPVTDGYLRATVLEDGIISGEGLKNNIIENLTVILDRQIEQADESTKGIARDIKDTVLAEMEGIDVTDGQAFSGLTATRKKGFIFGSWTRDAEALYNKLRSGKYDIADLKTAFNVEKPFVYSQLSQSVHSEGTPIQTLKVPTQIKDSEYLLVMAGAMLENAETGKPNLLKVLYDVMEESAFNTVSGENVHNNKGIDIFVFESGIKSGLTGISDITAKWANGEYEGRTAEEAEADLKRQLINQIYAVDEEGNTMFDEEGNAQYNDVLVKMIPVEDYAIQNKVPLHMRDHTQIWGSQMRAILESNLAYADYEGNPVKFVYTDSQGVEHSLGREEFISQYENAASRVIDSAINRLVDEFGLFGENVLDTKVAIAKELQREIKSNPQRYGNDLFLACTIDEDGNFRIPPGDPIQSKRVEQLINSIVKNRLNKPKVPGGLAVQVTNFGTSRRLNYRFFMKDGKTLLPTRDEWLADNPDMTEKDYIEYCRENQGGYAYEENYSPAHTKAFFTLFTDRNGEIDVEAIEMLDENLLLSIDQRTPTEFYYSMGIAKTVGFLPKEAGDGYMAPYEVPGVDDTDFDVDKKTKWKKDFTIKKNKVKVTGKMLREAVPELKDIQLTEAEKEEVANKVKERLSSFNMPEEIFDKVYSKRLEASLESARRNKAYEIVGEFLKDRFSPSKGKPAIWKALKRAYIKMQYTVEYPTEGEGAAMNDAWEMSKAVLQHESNASKKMSPGGPTEVVRNGYFMEALSTGRYSEDQLRGMSLKELEKIAKGTNMNLVYFVNQLEYYRRNNDASSNLGIFAVANTAHSLLEGQGYAVYNGEDFTIAGKKFGTNVELDAMLDDEGHLISKTLGANVAAAADAAKTPSHAYLNINKNTINEFILLIRSGMPFESACAFIRSEPIRNLVRAFNAINVTQYKSLGSLIQERLKSIADENGISEGSEIYNEELTKDELFQTIKGETSPEIEFKTLLMFRRLRELTDGMRMATFATRYNSVASAVGPQAVDNLAHEHQADGYGSIQVSDDTHVPTLLKKTSTYEYTRDNNREVKLGDVIEDADGNQVVITPQNLQALEEQGILNVYEEYPEVFIEDVLAAHPMLRSFSRGYMLADEFFRILNMPSMSRQFRSVLNSDEKVANILFRDTKLLSMFSDFYQSYLMIASKAISTENSKYDGPEYYLRRFPELFLKARSKYKGNALIDAIQPEVAENGTITLKLSTTGLKNKERSKLQAAWVQLYNQSQKLATDLFKYNFWKGGIGFSPKTFMNMLPIQMKEQIDGYISTYSDMPYVNADTVIDQFFRNNMSNNKLVRIIDIEGDGVTVGNGTLEFDASRFNDVKDSPYIKVKDSDNVFHIFKQSFIDRKNKTVKFEEVAPLGNNGEFVEINTTSIERPLFMPESAELESEETPNTDREPVTSEPESPLPKTDAQMEAEIQQFMNYLKDSEGKYLPGVAPEGMINMLRRSKQGKIQLNMEIQKRNLRELFEKYGIKYSDAKIDEIVKLMC